ncbi:hypothetical protein Tco_1170868 [Tanacetum coccineum]
MTLESIKNGPFVYPTVEEDGQIRKKKYVELTKQEQLQDDCDVQATNIVLQALPPDVYALVNHCTLSLVSEYLKDLEECMDDGDSRVAKEAKLFDALEHNSVVIEVDNQKIAIFTKAPLRAFGEPFMRYSLPCKVNRQGAWDAELDLADSANYVTEKVLENIGFVHVSLSNYGRKMVNDVNVEIHVVKFKADFVVLDYVNKGEPSILFGRDFLATTKSQVDFGLGEIRMNLTKFEEGIDVIDLLEEVGSSSEEVVKMGKESKPQQRL